MSTISDPNTIDAAAPSEDGKTLVLFIIDDLDDIDDNKHLEMLRAKIGSYVSFAEKKMYKSRYPEVKNLVINVRFRKQPSMQCLSFLITCRGIVKPLNCDVAYEIMK